MRIHRELLHERRMTGLHFWATGYCVSTVGLDEERIRRYIREQEKRTFKRDILLCEPGSDERCGFLLIVCVLLASSRLGERFVWRP